MAIAHNACASSGAARSVACEVAPKVTCGKNPTPVNRRGVNRTSRKRLAGLMGPQSVPVAHLGKMKGRSRKTLVRDPPAPALGARLYHLKRSWGFARLGAGLYVRVVRRRWGGRGQKTAPAVSCSPPQQVCTRPGRSRGARRGGPPGRRGVHPRAQSLTKAKHPPRGPSEFPAPEGAHNHGIHAVPQSGRPWPLRLNREPYGPALSFLPRVTHSGVSIPALWNRHASSVTSDIRPPADAAICAIMPHANDVVRDMRGIRHHPNGKAPSHPPD